MTCRPTVGGVNSGKTQKSRDYTTIGEQMVKASRVSHLLAGMVLVLFKS